MTLKPRDWNEDEALYTDDPDMVVNALLLTDFQTVDESIVRSWTPDQRNEAFQWAAREHLHAGDNDEVVRCQCPAHVERLRRKESL